MMTANMESWRHRLFATGFSAIAATRADRWMRDVTMGRGVILTFHHVRPWRERTFAPNRALEITPEFLRETVLFLRRAGFDILSMDEVPDRLRSRSNARPFAVLTFDDGYRDNLEYAWPILKDLNAPWTLYAVSDFAEGNGCLWWIELERIIEQLDKIRVHIGGEKLALPARTLPQKNEAFKILYRRLKRSTGAQLRNAVAELSQKIGLDSHSLVRELCATWDEIALLARDPGVTIGSHTFSHAILTRRNSFSAAHEIVESKPAIERKLGRPVHHFSYPHGDAASATSREFELCGRAGYTTAVTTRPGHLFARHASQLMALPRVSINGLHQSQAALRALLSGIPFMPLELFSREWSACLHADGR